MAKLTKIIRSSDPVSETEANRVFELLIPIVETDPYADAAVETAGNVIGRIGLDADRHLAHVLDWWYVATTGRRSANGGAHRLPASLDEMVKSHMDAVISLLSLGVELPAAEWLDKRRQLDSMLAGLDETLRLDHYGTVKLPGEREVWSSFSEQLGATAAQLKGNRQAKRAEVDFRKLDQELRDRGVEGGSRRHKQMLKRCREATDEVNRIVDLQGEVEPWTRRVAPGLISEVPSDFKHAVGQLAEALLRPILAANVAPPVDRAMVAAKIDYAARSGDRRGRYKLARVVGAWCDETGESIVSLEDEIRRDRNLSASLSELEAKSSVASDDLEEINLYVLDDDIDEAEKALESLQEHISRRERAQLAHRQLEGLRRKIRESRLGEDAIWIDRVADIENRFDSADPHEMAREIGAAQTELSAQLDRMLQEQQEDLQQLLEPLTVLGALESAVREWDRKIVELERRDGRGSNELKQEIEGAVQQLREERRAAVVKNLSRIDGILTDEREDFSNEDIGYFANWHSEIEAQLQVPDLPDAYLFDARQSSEKLWDDLQDRRIFRWEADQGEGDLVDHLITYCRGVLDFDPLDIKRLYVSLKTRPFVILAGLTGSGKSSLTRTYAEAFGASGTNPDRSWGC